jgi:hypothetical protein
MAMIMTAAARILMSNENHTQPALAFEHRLKTYV